MGKIHESLVHKKAWDSYRAQKERCKKSGLKVEYSYEEFEAWYLKAFHDSKWIDPTVSRLNHSIGYRFDNIILEERSDNSRERMVRSGQPINRSWKKVLVYSLKTGEDIAIFNSQRDCSRTLGLSEGHISLMCNNGYKMNRKMKDHCSMFGFKSL